jgi:thiosulfate/3-mercaptopyruvate sulfurtransferase
MPVPVAADPAPHLQEYAHPEKLVTTAWLADHLGDEGLVVVESDEDVLLYETGHIPGAVKIDWHLDLNDPTVRDYVDGERFAALLERSGVGPDTTVVLYGDRSNWWAAYALWVFELFGHADVRLLDGGRSAWQAEGRELTREVPAPTPTTYPAPVRDDHALRAFRDDVLAFLGGQLVDVRSGPEYTGERLHMPEFPQEGAVRGGHIPGAASVPWAKAADEDGRFRSRAELEEIYRGQEALDPAEPVIVYCRIGERASHTWFVLRYLLGCADVKNYDGAWTEWGTGVRLPVARGEERGEVPSR